MTRLKALLIAGACCALSACALLGKSDPVVPRFFTPLDDSPPPAAKPQGNLRMRLGHIEGLSHLREPMVVRSSTQEIIFSDERRWTERPEVYLRESLSAALFQQRGVVEVVSGRALTLDVELTAFEEMEQPRDQVRMQATFTLRDERLGLLEETITVDQPVAAAKGEERLAAVVDAYRTVLHAGVVQIADRVVAKLGESAAAAQ